MSYHGGPRHHHTGLATNRIFSGVGAIGSSGTAAGGDPPPVRNRSFLSEASRFLCLFCLFFSQQDSSCLRVLLVTLASVYLFVPPGNFLFHSLFFYPSFCPQ